MSDDNLTEYMQENILNILIQDDVSYKLIVPYLKSNFFESSYYRKIYQRVSFFILRFKRSPQKHVYDLLDKDIKQDKIYKEILDELFDSEINTEYVIERFQNFIRQQQLKLGVLEAAEKLEEGDIEEVEKCLNELRKNQVDVFDKGSNVDLEFLNKEKREVIPTAIKPLDDVGACPAKKELYSIIALPNKGKTQALVHLGKVGMMTRNKVLHVTLEMSEPQVKQRYIQSFFNVTKRKCEALINELHLDKDGYLHKHMPKKFKSDLTFYDTKDIEKILTKKLRMMPTKNLIIKEFPSGSLTVQGLRNYIDTLIDYENFHPDMILLDYPRKMKLSHTHLREELGNTYIQLRGLAGEYNLAMVIVAQINREGKKEKLNWLDESYLQEDFSLTNEADHIISYNQTQYEYEQNLGRLFLTKSRHDIRDLKILLAQNYSCCQFAVQSALLKRGSYKIQKGED